MEKVEHLSGTFKANCTALLLYGERGYPDGNESVLTERKAKIGMPTDFEEEVSISPRMDELVPWRAAEWDAAQNEGSGMEGKFLVAVVTFLANNRNCFEMTQAEF